MSNQDVNEQYLAQSKQINNFFYELQLFQNERPIQIDDRAVISESQTNDVCFYKIKKLSYDEDCPRREAFENVLLTLDDSHYNFVYILSGSRSGVELYIGVVNNFTGKSNDASDYGRMIQDAIEGNFSGSKLEKVKGKDLEQLLGKRYRSAGTIVGIPSLNSTDSDYDFQGTDRLINSMSGLDWRVIVVSEPVSRMEVLNLQESAFELYNRLTVASKASVQESKSYGVGITFGQGRSDSHQKGWSVHEDVGNSIADEKRTIRHTRSIS